MSTVEDLATLANKVVLNVGSQETAGQEAHRHWVEKLQACVVCFFILAVTAAAITTIVLKSDNANMVTGAWSVLSATVAATAGFFAGKKA